MKILTIKEQKIIAGGTDAGRCECYPYGDKPSGTKHIIAYREMNLNNCQEECCVKKWHKPNIIYVWYDIYRGLNDYKNMVSGFCDSYRDSKISFVRKFVEDVNIIYDKLFTSK